MSERLADRYELVAPLGAGGMEEVQRARDAVLGRDVAVKVPPEELADDLKRRGRCEREVLAAASLLVWTPATLNPRR